MNWIIYAIRTGCIGCIFDLSKRKDMAYQRKTEDEFNILADYGYGDGWEIVTCEATRKLAKEQIKTYRVNEPGVAFRIVKNRVPIIK